MTNITKVQHKKDKTLKQSYQKASLKGWVLTALWKRPLSSQISSSEVESSRFCCKGFSDLLGTYGYESSVIYADACPCRAIQVKTWISKWTLKFIGNNWLVCEYLKDLGKHLTAVFWTTCRGSGEVLLRQFKNKLQCDRCHKIKT